MEPRFLFPHSCKRIGWILAVPAAILMILVMHFDFTFKFLDYTQKGAKHINFDNGFLFNIQFNNFTDEVGSLLLICGLLLIAFSKEKVEDERIATLRLESLVWAIYVNSAFLIFSIIFFYSSLFLDIMAYNICVPLILFVIRFNYVMFREKRILQKEIL
jgi:hypothetical protein